MFENLQLILTQIISLLTGGLTNFGTGIASALSSITQSLFIDTSGTSAQISVFGGMVAVFGGLALAVSLSRKLWMWVTSLGATK